MKKKLLIAVATVLFIGAIVTVLLNKRVIFDGDRINNPNDFSLKFTKMNKTDSVHMSLNENDQLAIEFSIEKGSATIKIEKKDGEVIFETNQNNPTSGLITIHETGEYIVTVIAKNAKGEIHIYQK